MPLIYTRRRCDTVSGCGHVYPRSLPRCPICGLGEEFSDPELANMRDYIYDIETYPNCALFTFRHVATLQLWTFEVSTRRSDIAALFWFIKQLQQVGGRGVGYNNIGFDYPVLHWVLNQPQPDNLTAAHIYHFAMSIIDGQKFNKFSGMVYESDWIFPQVDLYKIHHFDNDSKRTSLKVLQFNMDVESVEDLPFELGKTLTPAEMDELRVYNIHDVDSTLAFYHWSAEALEFREQVSAKYGRNFMNHNDTKVGKDFFIMRLEEHSPGICFDRSSGRKVTRQTVRKELVLADAVFPYIQFETPEFQRIRDYFVSQTITETKGVFEKLTATVNGVVYKFGTGGLHASIDSAIVESDEHYQVEDIDVSSFYPMVAIVNKICPAHLGAIFSDIYGDLRNERKKYKKGSTENATLKLALNGSYGDMGSKYSPLFDQLALLAVTINGQLLQCLLVENLLKIPGLSVIQANTDGVTVRCPRVHNALFREICEWWQKYTCLELEFNTYSRMFIRDVNSYIAEGIDGKIKRKGAYAYMSVADGLAPGVELNWWQNHSGRVIARAAEAALLDGEDIGQFVRSHPQARDFYMLAKVPRTSRLMLKQPDGSMAQIQGTSRYYVSNKGGQLVKIMPPLPKKPDTEREIGIDVGWNVTIANRHGPLTDINYGYYIAEAQKLVQPLKRQDQRALF